MKTEDFERLKAVCEKEGFTIESYSGGKTAIIGVKDEWEGVEFVQEKDTLNIYKVRHFHDSQVWGFWVFSDVEWIWKDNCKPSTESAYVEQLKKEAFERFGEIKVGDMFIGADREESRVLGNPSFHYWKITDHLNFGSVPIYFKGKWAERVKERVSVEFLNKNEFGHRLDLHFQLSDKSTLDYEGCQFLAQQLEKYLNNEIE